MTCRREAMAPVLGAPITAPVGAAPDLYPLLSHLAPASLCENKR